MFLFGNNDKISIFLVAPLLPSEATHLVTMASVCMHVCSLVEIFFTKGTFFDGRFGMTKIGLAKKPPTLGSYGHFKNYFLVHFYTFYNFKMAITAKLS